MHWTHREGKSIQVRQNSKLWQTQSDLIDEQSEQSQSFSDFINAELDKMFVSGHARYTTPLIDFQHCKSGHLNLKNNQNIYYPDYTLWGSIIRSNSYSILIKKHDDSIFLIPLVEFKHLLKQKMLKL